MRSFIGAEILLRTILHICWFVNWPPCKEDKEKLKKEADHSRLAGGSFHKQENLRRRLVLGGCKTSRSLNLIARIWAYMGALTGFSHITIHMVSTTHYSLKAASLKMAPAVGMVGGMYIPRRRRVWGASDCLGSAYRSPGSHVHSMTSSNNI